MQRPCQKCGFISDRPTRFCRQCGTQLFVENEASSSTTRQYAQRQPATPYDAPYQSQLAQVVQPVQGWTAPENRSGGQQPGAAQLYHNQMAPQIPNYQANNYPAGYQQAAPKKSGALKWILITTTCVVLVSVAISAMVISVISSQPKTPVGSGSARRANQPSQPQAPSSVRGESLEQYKYPNAIVKSSSSIFGMETLTLSTSDSVSVVGDYYKRRLGNPIAEDAGRSVIFNVSGSPTIVITISREGNYSGQTVITMVKTNQQLQK